MADAKLIILNGASGSGKTFAMEKIIEVSSNLQPIKKYTTRAPRSHEDIIDSVDLVFNIDATTVRRYKYCYKYFGEEYGIDAGEIDSALKAGKSPIVIVRDYKEIIKLINDYSNTIVFYLHSAYTGEVLVQILKKLGREDIDANDRKIREIENFKEYIKHLDKELFNYHVYNYYDDTFVFQMKYYLSKHMEVYK